MYTKPSSLVFFNRHTLCCLLKLPTSCKRPWSEQECPFIFVPTSTSSPSRTSMRGTRYTLACRPPCLHPQSNSGGHTCLITDLPRPLRNVRLTWEPLGGTPFLTTWATCPHSLPYPLPYYRCLLILSRANMAYTTLSYHARAPGRMCRQCLRTDTAA